MFIVGKTFVSIRMIILDPSKNKGKFETWMTGTFLDAMGGLFKPGGGLYQAGKCPKLNKTSGLESIIFLRGNKHTKAVQSDKRPPRKDSTPAGANADYAWITSWTDWDANKVAWSCPDRPLDWYNNVTLGSIPGRGLWNQFIDWCHPKNLRPQHGPAYDSLGVMGSKQVGRGAGCLVEGFEVLYNKSNWP